MHVVKMVEGRVYYWNNDDGTWDSAAPAPLPRDEALRLFDALYAAEAELEGEGMGADSAALSLTVAR